MHTENCTLHAKYCILHTAHYTLLLCDVSTAELNFDWSVHVWLYLQQMQLLPPTHLQSLIKELGNHNILRFVKQTSLLRRLQEQTLPDEASPIGRIHPFSKWP